MGSGASRGLHREASDAEVPVHVPRSTFSLFGGPRRGAYSPGELTMVKVRSRSDVCLGKLIRYEELRNKWLQSLQSSQCTQYENLIRFYVAVLEFKAKCKVGTKREMDQHARELYAMHISPNASCQIQIDEATRKTVEMALKAASSSMFDLAAEKVYQILKLDAMPAFLVSEQFDKIEVEVARRRGSNIRLLGIRSILTEVGGTEAFAEYLKVRDYEEGSLRLAIALDATALLAALHTILPHVQPSEERTEQIHLLVKGIHLKIEQGTNSQAPIRLEREIAQCMATKQRPSLACVEELMEWTYDSLQERFLEDFFSSYEYRNFLSKCSGQYFTDNLVAELVAFRQDRKLQSTRQEMDDEWQKGLSFEAAFEDSLLGAYFRRFLRIQFCEENFLFTKEVEDFKQGSYGAPKFGPPLKDVPADATEYELMVLRAQTIYDRYLPPESTCCLNISDKLRSDCTVALKKSCDTEIFDPIVRELRELMMRDAFPRFKHHALFKHYCRAKSGRLAHKHAQLEARDDALLLKRQATPMEEEWESLTKTALPSS